MSNLCCFMQEEELAPQPGATPCWPPLTPPLLASVNGLRLVRGYLKRKSSKGGETTKWALRWLEVDPPEDDRPDYMLSVYKNDLKQKRLNAVSLRKITDVALCETPCAFVVSVGENSRPARAPPQRLVRLARPAPRRRYTLLARDTQDAETWVRVLNESRKTVTEGAPNECLLS